MKNIGIATLVILLAAACQQNIHPIKTPLIFNEIKNESGQVILVGHAPLSVLQKPPYHSWYDVAYQNYKVDTSTISLLREGLANKTMDIYLGSWCGDSKREVPRMLKILNEAGFDSSRVSLVFVDNSTKTYKQSPQREEQGKAIHHVPTFILYDQKKEIGRIVESPVVSLENDLKQIVQHLSYTPNYKAIQFWTNNIVGKNKWKSDEELRQLVAEIKPLSIHYGEFNAYGYVLLAANKTTEALNVFRLNTFMYPTVAGVFDSLGEAWATIGKKPAAIAAYQKVLELKPGDQNALDMLNKLK